LIHKATGGWLREAGKKDRPRLLTFLDKHAATMPHTALRYAIERLDKKQRNYYIGLMQQLEKPFSERAFRIADSNGGDRVADSL
jgi:hypothetical protein